MKIKHYFFCIVVFTSIFGCKDETSNSSKQPASSLTLESPDLSLISDDDLLTYLNSLNLDVGEPKELYLKMADSYQINRSFLEKKTFDSLDIFLSGKLSI